MPHTQNVKVAGEAASILDRSTSQFDDSDFVCRTGRPALPLFSMTKPAKKILLGCLVVALVAVFIRDRMRVHEAEQVRTDEQISEFVRRYLSPSESWIVERRHGANTDIIRLPVLPFIAREYRWTKEYLETEITFESEIVLYWPWHKYK